MSVCGCVLAETDGHFDEGDSESGESSGSDSESDSESGSSTDSDGSSDSENSSDVSIEDICGDEDGGHAGGGRSRRSKHRERAPGVGLGATAAAEGGYLWAGQRGQPPQQVPGTTLRLKFHS